MTTLYGYGNTVHQSGAYTLVPAIPLLGLISVGGGSVEFSQDPSGQPVVATVDIAPSLIGVAGVYSITAGPGSNVTSNITTSLINAIGGINLTADGGTLSFNGANAIGLLSGTNFTIQNGGTLDLGSITSGSEISALSGSGITFGTGGGTLLITPSSGINILTFKNISGFEKAGSTIEIPGARDVINSTYDSDSTSITTDTGVTVKVSGVYTSLYKQESGGNLYISASPINSLPVCFLSGSMIRTSKGDVAVEDIQIGDQVVTFDWRNNQDVIRPVIWTGKGHCKVRFDLPDDEAGWPVRVIKNAISDGVPYKDMLITAEHCLFFEGKFVPVRMLVNGQSIFYDKSITSYDYYHVETEQHSVITADGMLTESYLDTGNRRSFRQEGKVVSFGGTPQSWEEDGGAPLSVSRDIVEPLFRQIEVRAKTGSMTSTTTTPLLTEDADLHLVTTDGRVIRQARQANGYAMFMIPSDVTSVRIASRTSRPSDTIGPFVDDRRHLGVLVGEVSLFDSRQTRKIDTHLTDADLAGWDVQEASPCRWTNGSALLPLGERQPNTVGMLAIQILAAGPYNISPETTQAAIHKA
ncbi:Hint domain-containing protein [Gluconobacter oxydans]|nr:Hint domain-containing protein [Gluconobacter oxydans]